MKLRNEVKGTIITLGAVGIALTSFMAGAAIMEDHIQQDAKEDILSALHCHIDRDGIVCSNEETESKIAEMTGLEEADGGEE